MSLYSTALQGEILERESYKLKNMEGWCYFFASQGNAIREWPELLHPSVRVEVADVYYYRALRQKQFWVAVKNDENDKLQWRGTSVGSAHPYVVGRKLGVNKNGPTWLLTKRKAPYHS